MEKQIFLLIPLGILVFIFNIILDNENAIFWGSISAIPCFIWFLIGKNQVKSIKEIDYKSNSYDYLVAVREKINQIRSFNKIIRHLFNIKNIIKILLITK